MAIADMFLFVTGAVGETNDETHKDEIDVVSWAWGMQGPTVIGGQTTAKAAVGDLQIVKRVDKSTTTLMNFLRNNKTIDEARLTVRKAGDKPLEYFRVELKKVRIRSLTHSSEGVELVERLSLGFTRVRVSYVPQGVTGAMGSGASTFEADTEASS
jgi:type VI secretion system secreted protein Hcp